MFRVRYNKMRQVIRGLAPMSRTYPLGRQALRPTAIAMVVLTMSLGLSTSLAARQSKRGSLFDSQKLDEENFVVLAQPVGNKDWKLLVLEQIKASPRCWKARPDGLINPSLNGFNFAGICSRYLDSNGYSLRTGKEDISKSFRLRIQQKKQRLSLLAMNPNRLTPITVGRANVPRRDRNGFVQLTLEPGWRLERRVYKGRQLSHIYFANPAPVNALIAKASGIKPLMPNGQAHQKAPIPPLPSNFSRNLSLYKSGRPVRIPVIPYRR